MSFKNPTEGSVSKCNLTEGRDEDSKLNVILPKAVTKVVSKCILPSRDLKEEEEEEDDDDEKKKKKVCSWKLVSRPYFLLATFLKKENR